MVIMKKYSLTIRGSESSPLLRNRIDELYADFMQSVQSSSLQRFQVSLAVENGPAAPGPDRFSCTLIATFRGKDTLCIREESNSLYDAVQEGFSTLRSSLYERKRNIVDRRNDPRRISRRYYSA
jgi:ribosome-associated translation inhibitor RaiA